MSDTSSQGSFGVREGDSDSLGGKKTGKSDAMSKADPTPIGGDIPDCAVCLQSCIHPVQLPCSHVFCFLCMKGASTQYRRCALCRQEIPVDFFTSPKLLRLQDQADEGDDDTDVDTDEHYTWFYEGRNGWWQYDERTDTELEESYRANKRTFELLIAGYVYVIDLDSMLQYRRADPSRRRRIKRDLVSAPKKGIAGLKIKVKREEEGATVRQVDGAEEDKENAGAVGGAIAATTDVEGSKPTNKSSNDEGDYAPEVDGVKSDKSSKNTSRTPSPNLNHSNSIADESVYEVVSDASSQRTTGQAPPAFRYANPPPQGSQLPAYAMPNRQRSRPSNESPSANLGTSRDAHSHSPAATLHPSSSPSDASGVPVHHQRTHSAPEARPTDRPRGNAPPAPPRSRTSHRGSRAPPPASERPDAGSIDSEVRDLSETMRSELVINIEPSTGARRRQAHHQVHEV